MPRPTRLSDDEITAKLADLGPGWAAVDHRLKKTFEFDDFVAAFGWMTKVAIEAERLNHHPNWSNVYRTVRVELWTHDVDGLTELDLQLAAAMDRHAG